MIRKWHEAVIDKVKVCCAGSQIKACLAKGMRQSRNLGIAYILSPREFCTSMATILCHHLTTLTTSVAISSQLRSVVEFVEASMKARMQLLKGYATNLHWRFVVGGERCAVAYLNPIKVT